MLIASLIALLLGPLIYQMVERKRFMLSFIDGFAFVAISGLIFFHQVAESDSFDIWSFLLIVIGCLGPNIIETNLRSVKKQVHLAALFLAVVGLAIHAAADGAALQTGHDSHGHGHQHFLPLAIILHRIPDGLCLWWLMRPHVGRFYSWLVIVVICLATTAGYIGAENFQSIFSGSIANYFQSFVAGSILHVVLFRLHVDHNHDDNCCTVDSVPGVKSAELSGNFIALAILVYVFLGSHELLENPLFSVFFRLLQESAPALVLAYVLSIFIFAYIPRSSVAWLKKGGRFKQAVKGLVVGLPLPLCSCGVLPFYVTLINKGVPVAAALAFLIATPGLGLDSFLLSFPLLGVELTLIRLGAAIILALTVGYFLHVKQSSLRLVSEEQEEPTTIKQSIKYGLQELVDNTAPWVLLGILIASIAEITLGEVSLELPYNLDILMLAVIGAFDYVCASGATPLAAVLFAKGVSVGGVVTFLLMGPATNITTFAVLTKLHGKRFALKFAVFTTAIAIVIGLLVNLFFTVEPKKIDLHQHASHSSLSSLSLIIFLTLIAWSFFRKGARGFVAEIFGKKTSN